MEEHALHYFNASLNTKKCTIGKLGEKSGFLGYSFDGFKIKQDYLKLFAKALYSERPIKSAA